MGGEKWKGKWEEPREPHQPTRPAVLFYHRRRNSLLWSRFLFQPSPKLLPSFASPAFGSTSIASIYSYPMASPTPPGERPRSQDLSGKSISSGSAESLSCPTLICCSGHPSSSPEPLDTTIADMALSQAPEPSQKPEEPAVAQEKAAEDAPGVRFSAAVQEISPTEPAAPEQSSSSPDETAPSSSFTEVTADQLKAFTKSLHGRPLQELRLTSCQFEPFSLPPSRVCAFSPSFALKLRLPESPHTALVQLITDCSAGVPSAVECLSLQQTPSFPTPAQGSATDAN